MGRGRPTVLDERLIAQICSLVRYNGSPQTSAVLSGISRETYHKWKQKYDQGKASKLLKFFFSELEVAFEEYANLMQKQVTVAAGKDVRAAQWWLERRKPDEYGRKDKVRIEDSSGRAAYTKVQWVDDESMTDTPGTSDTPRSSPSSDSTT